MKRFLSAMPAVFLLFLSVCRGDPDPEIPVLQEGPFNESPPVPQANRILDYQGKSSDQALPRWLEAYLAGGNAEVEALPEYEYMYAFVGENSGPSPSPLETWRRNFDTERAFSRLAGARIRFRFIGAVETSADEVYGGYYQAAVKAAYGADYTGPQKEGDFWILEEPGEDPERAGERGRYRYFVFVLVPKDVFEEEVRNILEQVKDRGTRDQNSACEKLREHFFEGF
ncbi:MAG: hypothetical protein LBG26_04690 [Treponema sp.]|nr:hypothetical protein [Treponema sp.]